MMLQLRAARSASARELLYSVPLSRHLVPLAAISHARAACIQRACIWVLSLSNRRLCSRKGTGQFICVCTREGRKPEGRNEGQEKELTSACTQIIVRYILTAVMEARNQEGESSSDDDVTKQLPSELTEAQCDEGWEGWERACIHAVQVMDDLAMPHALAQALWTVPPQFSILFAGCVCAHACVCVHVCVCMCVRMRGLCACVCVCACVRIGVCVCVQRRVCLGFPRTFIVAPLSSN